MKSREVDSITSNEQSVRMRIFDGELPANEAYQALLEIEQAQSKASDALNQERVSRLLAIIRKLTKD